MNQPARPAPAIVFDFGGVLIDWNPRYLYQKLFADDEEAMERFLAEIGFIEWNLEQDRGRAFAVAVSELSARFPHYADFIRAYDERWEESIGGAIEPTVALLKALKQAGYTLFGLSNWSAETFPRIRQHYPFFDWFDAIVLSGEVRLIKPDPLIFTLLLEKIGRAAGDCLYIDDSPANIDVARQLGFQTIHFTSSEQLASELIERGLLPHNPLNDDQTTSADKAD